MLQDIWVIKESGEKEKFSPSKVKHALKRTGLSQKETDEILAKLETKLYDGISTKKIYAILYELIESSKPEVSHRYNLKRALFEIGPEGYEFETFISKLLTREGYQTDLRQIIQGKCVSHEIDVVAAKGSENYMIECKFHNQPGAKCRVQTVLYVYSRFLDLREGAKKGRCKEFTNPWLITNTKFSEDVLAYAQCMGIPLLGWKYPMKKSLEEMIDRTKCYPVTVINMSNDILRRLLAKSIVTISDIPENPDRLVDLTGIPIATAKQIIERAAYARE
ncbi:Restriction endonuclease [Candidatus Bilamarchaeum dharawalense]|uniref:Restriction endonuclease n=1 Tax=Candidatus Bilamarchaeum dharawalense TaxID=2885759 RepID=A0A5E4LNP8_9ARCH|nr:Restriction endonuclease [Candidatus Bilamarchaeum dharawalense]